MPPRWPDSVHPGQDAGETKWPQVTTFGNAGAEAPCILSKISAIFLQRRVNWGTENGGHEPPRCHRRRRLHAGEAASATTGPRMQAPQRTILITGCSSGIGYHCAHALHEHGGWRVFASCRRQEDADRLAGEGLETLRLDLADSASIAAAVDEVLGAPAASSTRCSTTAPTASPAPSRTCRPTTSASSSRPISSAGTS